MKVNHSNIYCISLMEYIKEKYIQKVITAPANIIILCGWWRWHLCVGTLYVLSSFVVVYLEKRDDWLDYFFLFVNVMCLTLKTPRKNASENVVCWSHLLQIIALHYWWIKYRSKQHWPRTDCSYRSSLIWVHTVCHRSRLLKHFSRREKQTTFVVIG